MLRGRAMLNSAAEAEECDATGDDRSNTAKHIKKFLPVFINAIKHSSLRNVFAFTEPAVSFTTRRRSLFCDE